MTTAARKPKPTSDAKKVAKKVAAIESVGVRELRQNASKVLDLVKDGAIIEITEHWSMILTEQLVNVLNY